MALVSTRITQSCKAESILIFIYPLQDDEPYTLSLECNPNEKWSLLLTLKDDGEETIETTTFCFYEYQFEILVEHINKIRYRMTQYINEMTPHHIEIVYKGSGCSPRRRDLEDYGSVLFDLKQAETEFESNYEEDMDRLEIYDELRDLGHILNMDKKLCFSFYLKGVIRHIMKKEVENLIKDKECPVMLEPLEVGKVCMLPCKHLLSQEAFEKINKGEHHPKCPCCREECCPSAVKNL